ncbi:MAG: hypothetical protein ABSH00_09470 [Bryobacteraceae bacterium]|jgi:hypothetical protein
MTKKLLFVTTILLAVTLCLMAADASGKWMFEQQGRGGSVQVTLNLKVDGGALTGTLSRPGRDGNAMETPISDGKVEGNNVSFTVKREFNGNSFVTSYKGTLDGDSLKLEITMPGRDGNSRTTNVVAKRATM